MEHRLARLVQLGIRQARYFGRSKTKFQLYLAATVANLTELGPVGDASALGLVHVLAGYGVAVGLSWADTDRSTS